MKRITVEIETIVRELRTAEFEVGDDFDPCRDVDDLADMVQASDALCSKPDSVEVESETYSVIEGGE